MGEFRPETKSADPTRLGFDFVSSPACSSKPEAVPFSQRRFSKRRPVGRSGLAGLTPLPGIATAFKFKCRQTIVEFNPAVRSSRRRCLTTFRACYAIQNEWGSNGRVMRGQGMLPNT